MLVLKIKQSSQELESLAEGWRASSNRFHGRSTPIFRELTTHVWSRNFEVYLCIKSLQHLKVVKSS